MELSFELIKIIEKINENPEVIIIFAGLHGLAILLGVTILLITLRKIGIYTPKKNLSNFWFSIIIIFFIGWILGSASQMMFFFMGIPGIKMFLIYASMYLCIATFVAFNIKNIRKKYLKIVDKNKELN